MNLAVVESDKLVVLPVKRFGGARIFHSLDRWRNRQYESKLHVAAMQRAIGLSFVHVTLHEDTWTFIARSSFGIWEARWDTSTSHGDPSSPHRSHHFPHGAPNLQRGQIVKHQDGMQTVLLSGHNLVTILASLRAGSRSNWNSEANKARHRTLYVKLRDFAMCIDLSAERSGTPAPGLAIDAIVGSQVKELLPITSD